MIALELDSTKEAVSLNIDDDGVEELLHYLNFVKKMKDHIHLLVGNELSDETFEAGTTSIKLFTIRLIEK